jgi:hypothetical protein
LFGTLQLVSGAAIAGSSAIVVGDNFLFGGALDVVGGTVTTGTGGVRVNAFADLRIGAGGRVNTNGPVHIRASGLFSVSIGGKLDLTDEKMIASSASVGGVGTFSGSAYTGLSALIQSGHNGGAWNGSGIMSSAAASSTALGYAESADLFASFPATFAGQGVDSTALLLKYTYYGDANLDGRVNLADFNRMTGGFGGSSRWSRGNFDFDNDVDLQDFNKLAANFGQNGLAPDGAPGGGGDEDETVPSLDDLLARLPSGTEAA